MKKELYERILDLRDRISLDDDDTIYEEDYLLLDEVLYLIENIDIETQIYDYNNTVDIYKELEIGVKFKKQEKLLELYQTRERLTETESYFEFNENNIKWQELTKQIKELENDK